MKKICLTALAVFVIIFMLMSTVQAQAQTGSPQDTLNQYISDLQKNPSDYALREKIVKLAQEMKPAPAIPEAAREHYVMAATFVEKAKDNSGYERAIEQYKTALLAAPWWADAYKKLAISQKAAAHYDDAIASLNLYILTQPADTRDAQDEIYKLKALKQSAGEDEKRQREEQQRARESSPEGKFEALLKKIDGRRYTVQVNPHFTEVLDVRGSIFVTGTINCWEDHPCQYREMQCNTLTSRFEIRGRETTLPDLPAPDLITQRQIKFWVVGNTYIISEDGSRITRRMRYNDGDVREYIYLWQR